MKTFSPNIVALPYPLWIPSLILELGWMKWWHWSLICHMINQKIGPNQTLPLGWHEKWWSLTAHLSPPPAGLPVLLFTLLLQNVWVFKVSCHQELQKKPKLLNEMAFVSNVNSAQCGSPIVDSDPASFPWSHPTRWLCWPQLAARCVHQVVQHAIDQSTSKAAGQRSGAPSNFLALKIFLRDPDKPMFPAFWCV